MVVPSSVEAPPTVGASAARRPPVRRRRRPCPRDRSRRPGRTAVLFV